MKTAIDRAGRLVVPKALRDELGLQPGRKLEIRVHDGALVIEPLPTRVKLVRCGKRMVAVPAVRLPPLTRKQCARRWSERGDDLGWRIRGECEPKQRGRVRSGRISDDLRRACNYFAIRTRSGS